MTEHAGQTDAGTGHRVEWGHFGWACSSIHKACPEHWAPIMRVLGEQQTWQQDAMTTEEARRG